MEVADDTLGTAGSTWIALLLNRSGRSLATTMALPASNRYRPWKSQKARFPHSHRADRWFPLSKQKPKPKGVPCYRAPSFGSGSFFDENMLPVDFVTSDGL
jgi:hypothetical protein